LFAFIAGAFYFQKKQVSTMATEKEMYEIIGRAMLDDVFRTKLASDPARATIEAGYHLTEEQVAALKQMDLKSATESLGRRLSKAR
jgi:hypothetical protein